MKEIIEVQVGHSGNALGFQFWEYLIAECNMTKVKFPTEIYFDIQARNVTPRLITVDSETRNLDNKTHSRPHMCVKPQNIIKCNYGKKTWYSNFCKEGRALADQCIERIRVYMENCDFAQGFQITNAIGGGIGGGFSSSLMQRLQNEYCHKIIETFNILSPIDENSLHAYNSMFTIHHLKESANMCHFFDNAATNRLFRFSEKIIELTNARYATVMLNVTSPLRFVSDLNSGMKRAYFNEEPFPGLHFLVPVLVSPDYFNLEKDEKWNSYQLLQRIFDQPNICCDCEITKSKILSLITIFRGGFDKEEFFNSTRSFKQRVSKDILNFNSDCIKTGFVIGGDKQYMTSIINTINITDVLERYQKTCENMIRRKAFFQYYLGEGMEQNQFSDYLENLEQLIASYKMHII